LRLVARIPPDKRVEFIHSAQSLLRAERTHFRRTLVLQDVDDRSVFCWIADGEAPEGLRAILDSSTLHALKGAADVLGTVEELRVLEGDAPLLRGRHDVDES
jgi:hypothetical protein